MELCQTSIFSSLTDNQQCLFAYLGGQFDIAQLQTAYPPRHVFLLQRIEHILYLLALRRSILFGRNAHQSVQLLVVVILRLGIGLQKRLALAHQMLPAALAVGRFGRLGCPALFGVLAGTHLKGNQYPDTKEDKYYKGN